MAENTRMLDGTEYSGVRRSLLQAAEYILLRIKYEARLSLDLFSKLMMPVLTKNCEILNPGLNQISEKNPPLCRSPGRSTICHQVNNHLHQGDQDLTGLFLDEKF